MIKTLAMIVALWPSLADAQSLDLLIAIEKAKTIIVPPAPTPQPGPFVPVPVPVTGGVQWVSEAQAIQDSKPIWRLFTRTQNCPHCVRMERMMNDPAVINASRGFSCVKFDGYKGSAPLSTFIGLRGKRQPDFYGCPPDASSLAAMLRTRHVMLLP